MEKDNAEDILIRKWLEGELSDEKIKELCNHERYKDYKRIIDATENLSVSEYNIEGLFSKILDQKDSKAKPVKRLK